MQVMFYSSIFAFLITLAMTPVIKKIAARYKICAFPNHRTVHNRIVPKLGGIAIYLGFLISLLGAFYLYYGTLSEVSDHVLGLIIGATLILFLGIYDDIWGANCYQKLTVQSVAALIAIYYGYGISSISLPFGATINLGMWGIPLTILWITGISNAINLIDGLDGLAAGISLGVVFTFFLISLLFGDIQTIFSTAILIGVISGFLVYNFNPAKIFMGDSGSLLIGFILACFAINGTNVSSSAVKILIPVVALGVPIIDTLLAILRRLRKHVHPFKADKEHIHHRLLFVGFSQRKAVILLYLVNALFGITAFLISIIEPQHHLILLSLVAAVVIIGMTELSLQFRNGKRNISSGSFR
jgi:UDP-GlcNAc:undecaprenyl-phosphate GlcNAc-1-phosphate transferase